MNPQGTALGDAGGAAGSSLPGQGYLTELGITNTGSPSCINDALTNAAGGYHQLCFGANALGGGLITYGALGGALPLGLNFNINGALYGFPGPGNGNIMGPSSGVTVSYVPLWNSSPAGTLLLPGVPAGQVSANSGAVMTRAGDRLFVGKNTNVNDGNLPSVTKDWLETIFPNTTAVATIAALGQQAGLAMMGGVRTSDGASGAFSSGVAGFCINNFATGLNTSCSAGYFEAEHPVGGHSSNYTSAVEVDIDEINSGAGYPVRYQPYTTPFPNGLTDALRLASGGVRAGAQPATDAIAIINNGSSFRSGIVFQQNSIYGTGGLGGQGEAIAMAMGHQVNWYSPDGNINSTIVGVGTTGTPTAVLSVGNGGLAVTSSTSAALNIASASGANSAMTFYTNGATSKYSMGTDGTGNNFVLADAITSANALALVSGNLTLGETGASVIFNSTVKFGIAGNWAANGSVATTMTSLGPTGSHATVQEWLTVVDNAGVVRYVPAY